MFRMLDDDEPERPLYDTGTLLEVTCTARRLRRTANRSLGLLLTGEPVEIGWLVQVTSQQCLSCRVRVLCRTPGAPQTVQPYGVGADSSDVRGWTTPDGQWKVINTKVGPAALDMVPVYLAWDMLDHDALGTLEQMLIQP